VSTSWRGWHRRRFATSVVANQIFATQKIRCGLVLKSKQNETANASRFSLQSPLLSEAVIPSQISIPFEQETSRPLLGPSLAKMGVAKRTRKFATARDSPPLSVSTYRRT
jgi:hypothetical protein